MKQSDILSFAINGVRREIKDAEAEVDRLDRVLEELKALDREDQVAIGRPEGFVPNTEWSMSCSICNAHPCCCKNNGDIEEMKRR